MERRIDVRRIWHPGGLARGLVAGWRWLRSFGPASAPEPVGPHGSEPRAALWQRAAAHSDAGIDRLKRRVFERFQIDRPAYIAAYAGFCDATGMEVMGRVLADPPPKVPDAGGSRWRNLREQWARFESDEVPGVEVEVRFGGAVGRATTDAEGYYRVRMSMEPPADRSLWRKAEVTIPGSGVSATHAILAVNCDAEFGIISDIDDTVLDSRVVDWKASARLTFLHNVRTRKPLPGVSQLYRSLQAGSATAPINPLFYVSSSPWNLHDLLESFLAINEIPPGPILLRDLGVEPEYFIKSKGHGHKLENALKLFAHFPELNWVLVGDSGQADAEIYAEIARQFPERVRAIYIRDVDPQHDSDFDRGVDAIIAKVSGVPMLRVRNSDAIADHARSIGLLPKLEVASVARDVARDQASPPQVQPGIIQAVVDNPSIREATHEIDP